MAPQKYPKKPVGGKKTGAITKKRKERASKEAASASETPAAVQKMSQEEAGSTSTSESTAASTQEPVGGKELEEVIVCSPLLDLLHFFLPVLFHIPLHLFPLPASLSPTGALSPLPAP